MNTAEIIYQGNLRTEMTHVQSGSVVITDAPTDNHGRGEAFSPTDLVATALGSCMITIMGIKAANIGANMDGTRAEIVKHMESNPRRIGKVEVRVHMPASLSDEHRRSLELAGLNCPVAKSLSPELIQDVTFHYA